MNIVQIFRVSQSFCKIYKNFRPCIFIRRGSNQPKTQEKKKSTEPKKLDKEKPKGENINQYLFVPYQKEPERKKRKVSVVGAAGKVGLAVCYDLLLGNYCDEIVMVDRQDAPDKLTAEWKDFIYTVPEQVSPKFKKCMNMENTKDSDLLIITAGLAGKPGQTRLELTKSNVELFNKIIPTLAKLSPKSVILISANPSEILTWIAWKASGFPRNRVLGTGTELDSCRFKFHIAKRLNVHPSSVIAWIIGEHGDSSVPVWSAVSVGGTVLRQMDPKIGTKDDTNDWNELHKAVVADGPTLVKIKLWTDWGISFVVEEIAKSILNNELTVHCVSTQLKGMYGITTDCFLSFPCVIGNRGIKQIMTLCLTDDEIKKLQSSADKLLEVINSHKL